MKLLELFAGSRSVGRVAEPMGYTVFSTDLKPFERIDLATDILDLDVQKIPFIPDVVWASPPCTFFSVASIGHHWHADHTPKTDEALVGVRIVQKTLDIVRYFLDLNPNLKWFMENPRGKLRKLDVVKGLPRTTVMYCRYGDTRMKPTDIWTNHLWGVFNPNGWMPRDECWNGNGDCHHEAAPRGSKTGTQGIKGAYDRGRIPYELVKEILISSSAVQTPGPRSDEVVNEQTASTA